MRIDIDRLTEDELYDLHNRIVERLNFFQTMKAHKDMLQFSVGDRLCFTSRGGDIVACTLVKYNKKTVTVITDGGDRWNVAPHFLSPLEEGEANPEVKGLGGNNKPK